MDRRHFLLTSLAGALAAPLGAEAQQAAQPAGTPPRIVILMPGVQQGTPREAVRALREGLQALGYVHATNLMIEERWNDRGLEHWPIVISDVLRSGPDVLVSGSGAATRALKQTASKIPVVSPTLSYPVEDGFAMSLARPGGIVTGLTLLTPELTSKRLELIKTAVTGLTPIALLSQSATGAERRMLRDSEIAARALGLQIALTRVVRDGMEIDNAFEEAARVRLRAVVLGQAALFAGERSRIATVALRHRMATIAGESGFAMAGGLLEYAPDIPDNYRRAAQYVDRILKGEKPGDLAIEEPRKVGLVINLKTAKALGLTIPPSLLARADQVIE
jgi:putative ABC transport system substrate-binding protein